MISEQNYNKLLEKFDDISSFAIYKESKNNDKATSEIYPMKKLLKIIKKTT